jgi:hypothetical protein
MLTTAALVAAAWLVVGKMSRDRAAISDAHRRYGALRGENTDLKDIVSGQRALCFAQADRLYKKVDKPDLTFPEELNLMEAKVMAGTWLENCKRIAPEDAEAVTDIFAVADTTLDRATSEYRDAAKKNKR